MTASGSPIAAHANILPKGPPEPYGLEFIHRLADGGKGAGGGRGGGEKGG